MLNTRRLIDQSIAIGIATAINFIKTLLFISSCRERKHGSSGCLIYYSIKGKHDYN